MCSSACRLAVVNQCATAACPMPGDLSRNAEENAIILIVCPLTSLMEDQVKKFTAMVLKAAFVVKAQGDHSVGRGVMDGEYRLVYMSPESMMTVLQWRCFVHHCIAALERHRDRRGSLCGAMVSCYILIKAQKPAISSMRPVL